ncbi:hypothetical protein [Streptomyces sp. cmx-4-9]|uniref:hypothetical protein n=1 Tax=Streptomyces sp. cmx-4-9 TaxID=2790941 RepID=UPI0039800D83
MTSPVRGRGLGRGVSQLIPQAPAVSPAGQAATVLAALQSVPIHLGVLQAAVVLLESTACASHDAQTRAAAAATVDLLRAAMEKAQAPAQDAGSVPAALGPC